MLRTCLALFALASPALALDAARGKDIVILGEVHDNAAHHQKQAELIRDLEPKAVVFEMLTPSQAETLNTMDRTDMAEVEARIGWASSGWPDFSVYQPVFEALGDLPAVGAAAPKSDVRRAFAEGAEAVFGPDAVLFGLNRPLPKAQLDDRMKMQFEAHCGAMPLEMMGGMVEAQRFRDAAFAQATLDALETFGAPVILIAGNGHARTDWGVPAMIAAAAPSVTTFSVGFVEQSGEETGGLPLDHVIQTERVERSGDPCATFKS